jgi:rhamnulokinase
MATQCYLGVDLGAESGRVMAGLFDGNTMQLEELHRFPNGPVSLNNTLRWDVLRLWSEISKGLSAAAEKYGDRIVSVGVDTWGVDYVLFSENFEILGQPYHYRDARTQGMLEEAYQRVPKEDIFAESGLQFLELNTLYQLLALQKENPDVLGAAQHLLLMPDFFHWCLSGANTAEFTEATTSQCFHPEKKTWAYDLLKRFDLPTHIFPEVVNPGTKIGTLLPSVSTETGLSQINVVAPASHDTGSAVAAVPTKNTGTPSWAYISSGTWSLVGVEIQDAIFNQKALELNFTNEGGVDGTYRFLKNIMGLWLVQRCKRDFEKQGNTLDYSQLTQMAADAQPFRSILNPDDASFLNPPDMTEAIREYCKNSNQPIPETEGQFVRCSLESLALKYDEVLKSVEDLTGTPIEVIHLVGGGSQNKLLNQLTANACNKPVITGPIEATVFGNLLVQARASGEVGSLSDIRNIVRQSTSVEEFLPQASDDWNEAKSKFAELAI